MRYENGAIKVPTAPGLGSSSIATARAVPPTSIRRRRLSYDRDPSRPGWFSVVPTPDGRIPTTIAPSITEAAPGTYSQPHRNGTHPAET